MEAIRNFFHKETPEEAMKKYKRQLDRTARDLDRERTKLQNQEKKINVEMKKMAKLNQTDSLRIMARDLIRTRKYAQKMQFMKTQIQGIGLRIVTMQSTSQMAKAMAGVGKAMSAMNQQMNLPAMQQIMQQFQYQNEAMSHNEEMMNDAIDDVMDDEGDETEEAEKEIQKVMDEVLLDMKASAALGNAKLPEASSEVDEDFEARYAALKKTQN